VNISNDVSQAQIANSTVGNPLPSARPAAAPPETTTGSMTGTTAAAGAAVRASGDPSATTGSQASDQANDQATISSASGLLSTALNSSDVRTAKVAALQASINAGTYNIPASSVAEKMLSSILGS
jgi:flagellar biosynthesis anti-sigma factor FlgM